MESNVNQIEQLPITPNSNSRKYVTIAIIILMLGGGIYYYQSNKKTTPNMDTQKKEDTMNIKSAKAEILKISDIIKNNDIVGAKAYFEKNGMTDWVSVLSDDSVEWAKSKLKGLGEATFLSEITMEKLNDPSILWSEPTPENGFKAVVVGANFKTSDPAFPNRRCEQIVEQNMQGEWYWTGSYCE